MKTIFSWTNSGVDDFTERIRKFASALYAIALSELGLY